MSDALDDLLDILDDDNWSAEDTSVLISCCGDAVEPDCPACPTCGAPNPLFALGLI